MAIMFVLNLIRYFHAGSVGEKSLVLRVISIRLWLKAVAQTMASGSLILCYCRNVTANAATWSSIARLTKLLKKLRKTVSVSGVDPTMTSI